MNECVYVCVVSVRVCVCVCVRARVLRRRAAATVPQELSDRTRVDADYGENVIQ